MGLLDHFSKFFSLLFLLNSLITYSYADPVTPVMVIRKEDEFLLPPYLQDYDGGILNVISEKSTDHTQKRSVKAGEWLEYGDSLSIPDRMSLFVLMNEGLQWVGGGVFDGKILDGKWNSSKPAYVIEMNRGWMKVWAKPSSFSSPLEIKTPQISLTVTDGVFWLSASAKKTEVYVLSGTVKDADHLCEAEKFYEWSGAPAKLEKTTGKWDFVSLEKRISQLYPSLVKLSHRANDDWLDESSTKKYDDLRSNGWKKADRYFPTPTPQK